MPRVSGPLLLLLLLVIARVQRESNVVAGEAPPLPPAFPGELSTSVSLLLHRPKLAPYALEYNVTQSLQMPAQLYAHKVNTTTTLTTLARFDMTPPMHYVITENAESGESTCKCSVSTQYVPIPELEPWSTRTPVVRRNDTVVNGVACEHYVQHAWHINTDTLSVFFSEDDGAGLLPIKTVWRYPPIPERPDQLLVETKSFTATSTGPIPESAFAIPALCTKAIGEDGCGVAAAHLSSPWALLYATIGEHLALQAAM